MIRYSLCTATFLVFLAVVSQAKAQEPTTWRGLISKYSDEGAKSEPSFDSQSCRRGELPDTVVLIGGPKGIAIAIGRNVFAAPTIQDTLLARLVGIACDDQGRLRRITYQVDSVYLQQQGIWTGPVPIIHVRAGDRTLAPMLFRDRRLESEQMRAERQRRELNAEYRAHVKAESERRSAEAAVQVTREIRISATQWPAEMKAAVLARHVRLGMTPEMVRESWGEPRAVNTTITAGGRTEQWVYSEEYVYLTNGVVTAIQTYR